MAKITIELSSLEAGELLFALKLRACQTRVPSEAKDAVERLRRQINAECERAFRWDKDPDRYAAAKNDIRVSVQSRQRW